jgi:hydrogenase expression/formation protein HypC
MCLGIPGEVLTVGDDELRTARISFGGVVKDVCLAYVPEAQVGDYVVVHAGFAISRLDREAAARVFSYLQEAGVLEDG